MKILLSWLNEYGDFGDPTDADAVAARRRRAHLARPRGRLDRRDRRDGRRCDHRPHPPPRGSTPTRPRCSGSTSTPATATSATCGAAPINIAADDIVPLATLGTTMPNGMTIERRGILGIDSEGMLCSAQELGLGDDHSGIRILPAGTPLGVPYGEALGHQPRRPDRCRRHPQPPRLLGVRRHRPRPRREDRRRVPAADPRRSRSTGDERTAPVEIVDGDRCARFTSTVISGVEVEASADVDAAPTHRGRHATDQQRRRRQQLRDARAEPAEPRLRPRHARRWWLPDPASRPTASTS